MVYENYEIFMFFYRLPTKERVVPQNTILTYVEAWRAASRSK